MSAENSLGFRNSDKHKKNLQDYLKYETKLGKLLNYPSTMDWALCEIDDDTNRVEVERFNIAKTSKIIIDGEEILSCVIKVPDFVESFQFGCIGKQLDTLPNYESIGHIKLIYNGNSLIDAQNLFNKCLYVKYIDLQEFNMSSVVKTLGMFDHCESLLDIKFKQDSLAKLKYANEMFKDCIGLKDTQSLQNVRMSSISDISSMFQNCYNLEDADLSFLDSGKHLKEMQYAFADTSIDRVSLSGLKPLKAVNMKNCFNNCTRLREVDISQRNNNNIKVRSIDSMFKDCNTLQKVDLQGMDFSELIEIRQLFEKCFMLKTFSLDGKDFNRVIQLVNNFRGCSFLKNIQLTNCSFKSLQSIKDNVPSTSMFTGIDITGTNLSQLVTSNEIDLDPTKIVEYGLFNRAITIVSGKKKFRLRVDNSCKTMYAVTKPQKNRMLVNPTKIFMQRVYMQPIQ